VLEKLTLSERSSSDEAIEDGTLFATSAVSRWLPNRRSTRCAWMALIPVSLGLSCADPRRQDLVTFMHSDATYATLPRGPQRVDALWARARALTGSNKQAMNLLGSLAVDEGIKLKKPFNTGLSEGGALSPDDKTGHFFAHAMWQYYDHYRAIPVAELNGAAWEVAAEIRSWFGFGDGFNWRDIWANRLGREFGRRLFRTRHDLDAALVPSAIIEQADRYRPSKAAADDAAAHRAERG